MALTLVVFAGFYATPRHTVHYANTLAQAACASSGVGADRVGAGTSVEQPVKSASTSATQGNQK